ncbi:MAG: SagB/ThcOx family dehydrogenase, partial [Planctomycetes bacterium]|nr:SagB/ThcOx family dehydrogenase [Planctomycetota bacterium]
MSTPLWYHNHTKHTPYRSAPSAGYMDWANQPNPFRNFKGCPRIGLSLETHSKTAAYETLYDGQLSRAEINSNSISLFFRYSLALSAWKSIPESRWSLRINPSSGNLHPTEAYFIGYNTAYSGFFHYSPYDHSLEERASFSQVLSEKLQEKLGKNSFIVGLSSILWRESWKYGERAYRYCNHDVGHALAALSFSASLLGWRINILQELSSDELDGILGFNRTQFLSGEEEHADILLLVTATDELASLHLNSDIISELSTLPLQGTAQALSDETFLWKEAAQMPQLCKTPKLSHQAFETEFTHGHMSEVNRLDAGTTIRSRRSAVDFDGSTGMSKEAFFDICMRLMPDTRKAPYSLWNYEPNINIVFFVHRVLNLEPGIYLLSRSNALEAFMREELDQSYHWSKVHPELPLFQLLQQNTTKVAASISCGQDI